MLEIPDGVNEESEAPSSADFSQWIEKQELAELA